jgi:uncharacterized SAM-binding protein YcdF (DUF218 family)
MDEGRGAIVILGAPNDLQGQLSSIAIERCEQALQELDAHPDFMLLPTGGWGPHFNCSELPHATYTTHYLQSRGVPPDRILEGALSSSTVEDARQCREIARRHGLTDLRVVTSDFHLERTRLVFTRELPDMRLTFAPAVSNIPEPELRILLEREREAIEALQEVEYR